MAALLSVMLFSVACTEDDKFKQESVLPVLPMEDTEVDPLGDQWVVSYTAKSNWTISTNNSEGGTDWVTFSTGSGGAGTTQVQITVLPNTTSSDRWLTVKFGTDSEFDIYQKPAVLEVGLDPEVESRWLRNEKPFAVKSNLSWRVTGIDQETLDWMKGIDPSQIYEKNKDLSLNFVNNNYSDKDSVVTISFVPVKKDNSGQEVDLGNASDALRDAVSELTREVKITQKHIHFLVHYAQEENALVPFSEFGEIKDPDGMPYVTDPYTQIVTVESETAYDYKASVDWISVRQVGTDETDEQGNTVRTLEISVPGLNTGSGQRDGKVTLTSTEDEGADRVIDVSQLGYQLSVKMTDGKDNEKDTFAVDSLDTAYLHVETRGPWKIADDFPEWMTVDPALLSGVGNSAPIPVSTDIWNLEFKPKGHDVTCTAEIQGVNVNPDPAVKKVYKAPFVFKIGENVIEGDKRPVKDVLEALPRKNTKTYPLQVDCSGPWEMTLEGGDWFEVSHDAADGTDILEVGANSVNPLLDQSRSVTLNFTSLVHRDHDVVYSIPLEVTQKGYIFNMFKDGAEGEAPEYDNVPAYKKDGIIYKVSLQCADSWNLRCDSGVSVTNASGQPFTEEERDGTIFPILYVHVETNLSKGSPKPKNIYVTSAFDGEEKAIKITQDAFVFDVDTKNIPTGNIAYNSQDKYTVDVASTAEAEWEVKQLDNSNWVVHTPALYTGNKTGLEFKVTQNGNTGSARQAKFEVNNKISGESLPFTFTQEAYVWNVTASDPDPFNEINANNSASSFKVKCSDAWKITGVPDWLSVSPTEGAGLDEKTVTIKPDSDNLSLDIDRTATLVIDGSYAGVDHKKQIKVTQQRFVFDVTGDVGTINLPDNKSTAKTIKIKSSDSWIAETDDSDVVTVSPEKGAASRDKEQACTLSIKTNYTDEPRDAEVTVQAENYSNFKKTVTINQPAYQFEVDGSAQTIAPAGVENQAVSVTCSGTWDVKSDRDWLIVKKGSGEFTFIVKPNKSDGKNDTQERTGIITVSTTDDSKNHFAPVTITVKQEGEKASK